MSRYLCIAPDAKLGEDVKLSKLINLYRCEVGDQIQIGSFAEIQKNVRIGKDCKISSHSFTCEGIAIEGNVFVGHGVTFINDSYPRATTPGGELETEKDQDLEPTAAKRVASIGSGAPILSNVIIGDNALVGASSVVTNAVPANAIVAGNPTRFNRFIASELKVAK